MQARARSNSSGALASAPIASSFDILSAAHTERETHCADRREAAQHG
jgi:hypothetical protein